MGTYNSRIVISTLLLLLGTNICSATRSLLFPGYGGGFGGGFPGIGGGFPGFGGVPGFGTGIGGFGPFGGGFPGFGGGIGGFGGGFPGFGGGYGGGIKKDTNVGIGAGSANEVEDKTEGSDLGAEKGPNGLAEGLGFGAEGHENKGGIGEGIGYHETGQKNGFGGPGFGAGCLHKSEVVKPGTNP